MALNSSEDVINALGLPESCLVGQRVPKKLLIERGSPNAVDRRMIAEVVDEIRWIATLKPSTIAVQEYRDSLREYIEIAIISIGIRSVNKFNGAPRLSKLVHRAVPYPLIFLIESENAIVMSLAHKRRAQNEANSVVLDGDPVSVTFDKREPSESSYSETDAKFLQSLSISDHTHYSLFGLYQGLINSVHSILASRITGTYRELDNQDASDARARDLIDCQRLESELRSLKSQASKAKQVSRRVELNLRIKQVQDMLQRARARL